MLFLTGAEVSFVLPAEASVVEADGVDMDVCVQLTSLPLDGIECDVDIVLQTQEDTAGQTITLFMQMTVCNHCNCKVYCYFSVLTFFCPS